MVRGTNKMIIEINDTQNKFFEKAVLYVRENHSLPPGQSLEQQADRYMASMSKKGDIRFLRRGYLSRIAQLCLSYLMGALMALVALNMV